MIDNATTRLIYDRDGQRTFRFTRGEKYFDYDVLDTDPVAMPMRVEPGEAWLVACADTTRWHIESDADGAQRVTRIPGPETRPEDIDNRPVSFMGITLLGENEPPRIGAPIRIWHAPGDYTNGSHLVSARRLNKARA